MIGRTSFVRLVAADSDTGREMTSVGNASRVPGIACAARTGLISAIRTDASVLRLLPRYTRDKRDSVRRFEGRADRVRVTGASRDIAKVARRGINNSSPCGNVFFFAKIFTASRKSERARARERERETMMKRYLFTALRTCPLRRKKKTKSDCTID